MIYIKDTGSNDPAYNIALEEYCFKNLRQFDEIFFLWRNEPTIVVGKYQNTIEEINSEYILSEEFQEVEQFITILTT